MFGFLKGPDKTQPTPAEDWKKATVDVVIPAHNEEKNIVLCLASVIRQTKRPQRIILIDDGSKDHTITRAKEFCDLNGVELIAIKRAKPIGKTPTLKRQSREFDSDVEFILDGDTVLESDNYIERVVQELYQGVGIASACGMILPIREKDQHRLMNNPVIQKYVQAFPDVSFHQDLTLFTRLQRAITNIYRDTLYMYLQKFIYKGQMIFFGSITNPVGCAVAYRRKYVKDLFDHFEPILGDDLTNSEDIFIGFAMLQKGYRNIQLYDVYARTREPLIRRLPRQYSLWSSSFLQSCYYFNDLLISPFKSLKRFFHQREIDRKFGKEIKEKRKIQEAYRQAFGREITQKYGRPIGWVLFVSALEKVYFPTLLLIMIILQLWEALAVTVLAETTLAILVLTLTAGKNRVQYFFKVLLVTPIRYATLLFDVITMSRFAADIWIFKNKKWRK